MTGIETMHQLRKGQVPFIDGKKTLNVAEISFTVALGSLGLFFQPFLIVRVLCLFLNKKRPGFSQLIFYSSLFAPLPIQAIYERIENSDMICD